MFAPRSPLPQDFTMEFKFSDGMCKVIMVRKCLYFYELTSSQEATNMWKNLSGREFQELVLW